jgi:hypothetical protein
VSKSNVFDWDTVAANNTDIGGINCGEGCAAGNANDWTREQMAQLKREIANKGSDIASAATTNIAASGTSGYARVTGSTTITSLGTAVAGVERWILFASTPVITHNATSLIMPGGVNVTTAAGDVACFRSEGSGNWRCVVYQTASGSPVGGFSSVTATSTDAGATQDPNIIADRASPSPAASDLIGAFVMRGRDSGGNATDYAKLKGKILDATNGSEDGAALITALVAGTETTIITAGPGVQIGAPTGGDPGAGKLNVDGDIQLDGVSIVHGIAQVVADTETTYTTLGTILPLDDTIPQITEGVEILSVPITPKNASSFIEIDFNGSFGGSTSLRVLAALFVDSTANALNLVGGIITNTSQHITLPLKYRVAAGSTSSRTYRIRAGSDVALDAFLNGDSTGRQGGGISTAILTAREILP